MNTPSTDPDIRCRTCGKLLMATVLRDTPLICSDPEPTQCYDCELKELSRKVADVMMEGSDDGYNGPPGSD